MEIAGIEPARLGCKGQTRKPFYPHRPVESFARNQQGIYSFLKVKTQAEPHGYGLRSNWLWTLLHNDAATSIVHSQTYTAKGGFRSSLPAFYCSFYAFLFCIFCNNIVLSIFCDFIFTFFGRWIPFSQTQSVVI